MADLHQIFGAILRDLAKARFSADLYSRSIARYYEANDLLRKFPVPRADVHEVDFDLKFSITEVLDSEVNKESQEANSAVFFERTVERLVSTFLNAAYEREEKDGSLRDLRNKYVTKGFGSSDLRVGARLYTLRYFIESYKDLIDDAGNFDVDKALESLERPFRWALEQFARDEYRDEGDLRREMKQELREKITQPVVDTKEIKRSVAALKDPLRGIWAANSDSRLEILVEGSQLAQLGEAAISSVKVKAVVRNMIWTEVVVDNYTKRHVLTPE